MSAYETHSLLLKTSFNFAVGTDQRWAQALMAHFECEGLVQSVTTAKAENGKPMHHVYVHFENAKKLSAEDAIATEKIWRVLSGHDAKVSRLQRVMQRQGVSHDQKPTVHYVVETDPEAGWQDEIFRWYDQEHMPGLASVPGTVRAQRLLNLDHSPLSFACDDLIAPDVLGSEAWLAVRGTAWSDVCRPHFTNTLRTMFEKINTQMQRTSP
jgi:hypothetical protein